MIKLEAWSEAAARELLRATSQEVLPLIRSEVERGVSQLYHCQDDYSDCYIVTRMEAAPVEWCFVAAAGHGCMKYARMFVAEGKARGISMRCHVVKDSLLRLWGRLGFEVSEQVLRVRAS